VQMRSSDGSKFEHNETTTDGKHLLSEAASKRKERLVKAQEKAKEREQGKKRSIARSERLQRVRKGIKKSAAFLYGLTPAKWIDDLERDQQLADRLEWINAENERELERKRICREAEQACLEAVRQHLMSFLQEYPKGTYEEWIQELHPENVTDGTLDHRFYVKESDHLILWNESLTTNTNTDEKNLAGGDTVMTTTRNPAQPHRHGLPCKSTLEKHVKTS